MEQMPSPKSNETTLTEREKFLKVLENVILLETEYDKDDLVFLFNLPWNKLERLLERYCTYEITKANEVIIKSTSPDQNKFDNEAHEEHRREEQERKRIYEELKKIYPMTFFKTTENGKRRYRSIKRSEFPADKQVLLDEAIKMGIIVIHFDNLILSRHLDAKSIQQFKTS